MEIKPISSDADLQAALARADALWGSPSHTPEGDELERLCAEIERYEAKRYPLESEPATE
ncbi:putative uncharacterized protein [Pseudomonas sp. StFLB209]|uniref:hypothetical protein n=1 Tax=Pseudomonas sp. StFLB209 TaxID=1028989 RepID=UPI0004F8E565|nr:hypothetical protein [Pseudomonas sp. StFLB209]BAP44780.1 putative uncharacterized protein [Pseudomonas sp. StFLB209]